LKNASKYLILFAAALAIPFPAGAQTVLTPTTLSSAIGDNKIQVMVVSSATGFVANTTVAYIDKELVAVKSVSGTTIGIIRGQGGTSSAAHPSGAQVFVGTPNQFFSKPNQLVPSGSCTRTAELVVPMINVANGVISDCVGGQWVNGVRTPEPKWRIMVPDPGGTAYSSINTAGTTTGATTVYCSEVNLPSNKLLTGIALLNGTTVGTDKHYVVLYDSAGNAIANSAVAGVTTSGASTYQQFAFTSTYYAVGPAQYFACFQANGTTDNVRMAVTGTNDNLLTKGQTGATFGTIPALTVPTTFTTAVGPYVYLY
jgi:hypothetical protein